jgi:uncharacterized membrane protein YhhN
VAHVCYIAAFTPGVGRHGASIARLVYGTLGVAMLAALWPVLDPLYRGALGVYGFVLIVMAGQAAARWGQVKTAAARSAGSVRRSSFCRTECWRWTGSAPTFRERGQPCS